MMRSVLDLLQRLMLLVQPVHAVVPPALQAICARLQTTVGTQQQLLIALDFRLKTITYNPLTCVVC